MIAATLFPMWALVAAAMTGGALGFMACALVTAGRVREAYNEGYHECCDDVAEGRIFDGVRWKLAEPENKPKTTAAP